MANSSIQGNTGRDSSGSITANDFLTLLVTEMKNQDPTATTDPNEYINQLVQVNSLQQLISINQTLQDAIPAPVTADTARPSAPHLSATVEKADVPAITESALTPTASGNLSIPVREPAASRLATALIDR
jgi:flagellar basal-body rod modification protein FlgD